MRVCVNRCAHVRISRARTFLPIIKLPNVTAETIIAIIIIIMLVYIRVTRCGVDSAGSRHGLRGLGNNVMNFRFHGEVATEVAIVSVECLRNNNKIIIGRTRRRLTILIPPFKNFNHSDMCYAKQKPTQKSLTASPINVPDKPKPNVIELPHYTEKGCFDNDTFFTSIIGQCPGTNYWTMFSRLSLNCVGYAHETDGVEGV